MNQICLCKQNLAEVVVINNHNQSDLLCTNCYLTIRGKKDNSTLQWWLKLTTKQKMNILSGISFSKDILLPKHQFFTNLTFAWWKMLEVIYNERGDLKK